MLNLKNQQQEAVQQLNKVLSLIKFNPYVLNLVPGGAFFNNVRILILGRSQWGKTTLAVGLFASIFLRYVDRIIVISPTYDTQPTLNGMRAFVKDGDSHSGLINEALLNAIIRDIQVKYAEDPDYKTLVFLDDLSADFYTNYGRKGAFAKLVLAAPHMGTSILAVFHQATSVTPTLRDNVEVIISFPPQTRLEYNRFVDEFLPYNWADDEKTHALKEKIIPIWMNGGYVTVIRRPRQTPIVLNNFNEIIS
jgi:hypothetical protein